MAKDIAVKIKITSDGQEKVIANLNELENELKVLQEQLKTADFGSARFKEIATNIQKLKSQIEDVDKATEGIGLEKRLTGIATATGALTGSFAILTGALTLFASEEEDLIELQKAEAKAMGALNIILGVREISEAVLEGRVVARQLAEKAATAATKIATAVQAAYNAVLAANPIGLVIAGLVALAAATYAVVKAVQSSSKEQDEANKILRAQAKLEGDLIEEKKKAGISLKQQLTILTDNVKTRNLELQTLEELKKTYPGLNAFINRNNELTKDGITFIRLQIAAEEARAAINILNGKRLDAEIKREAALNKLKTEGASLLNKTLAINSIFTAEQLELIDIAEEYGENVRGLDELQEKYTKQLDDTLGKLTPYNKKLEETAKAEEKLGKETKNTTQETDKELTSILKKNSLLANQIKRLEDLTKAELKYSTEIIKAQEKVVGDQEARLNEITSTLTTAGEKLREQLGNILRSTIPNEEDAAGLKDGYKNLFDTIGGLYEQGKIDLQEGLGFEEFVVEAEKVIPGLGKQLKLVGEDGKKAFVEFFNEVRDRVKSVNDLQKTLGIQREADIVVLNKISNLEDTIFELRKNASKEGKTENEVRQESLKLINDAFFLDVKREQLVKQIQDKEALIAKTKKDDVKKTEGDRLKALQDQLVALDNASNVILQQINRSGEFYKQVEDINTLANENSQKITENLNKLRAALTPEQFQGLLDFFKSNAEQFDTLLNDLVLNFNDYVKKVGTDGVKELVKAVEDGFMDIDNLDREQLEKLKSYLLLASGELKSNLGDDADFFIKLIEKITKKIKEIPTESEEALTDFLDQAKDITDKIVSNFNDIAGRLQDILSTQNSLLLEQLTYAEQLALKNIGEANTESAAENKKIEEEKLKISQEYAKKRFEIEKKARVQELQFSLASTIASSAQAVVNALATPPLPVGIALSAVIAGLTAFQVATINEQIQFTKSKEFIARRGGLIQGDSHEGGGVPALLEGGEFVMSKSAVDIYGDTLGVMNASVGSRPLAIDDSRLVQAIAKQNIATKAPIKTYVLYNDIQNTEKLNNKIEQLSRL